METLKKITLFFLLVILTSCNAQDENNKKENIMNEKTPVIFELDDFTRTDTDGDWRMYELKKESILLNKIFKEEPLQISVHQNYNLSEYLQKINEYVKWINGNDLKTKMENTFSKSMDVEIHEKWYDNVKVYRARIVVEDDGVMYSQISCRDSNWEQGILTFDLGLKENEIQFMTHFVFYGE